MVLKSCCCGCSLKTGSLVVGYMSAVMSGVGMFLCILAMLIIGDVDFKKYEPPGTTPDDEQTVEMVKGVLFKIYLFGAVICLKSLIINWMLINGVNRVKPALVLPWIIFFAAGMFIQTLGTYAAIALAVTLPSALWYPIMAFSTFVFSFQTYILIVVSSHYHKMKKSSLLDEEQIMM